MSSPFNHTVAASSLPQRPPHFRPPIPTSNAPPGTFAPGTKVQVGNHRVVIEKYLSEGGFAHVYVVRVPRPGDEGKTDVAVLKRVAVPDKESLANMRNEVETMKKLKGHKHIVTYIDSHASQLKGGGYEVFLLMEFCSGGGLIDFMNTRLQHRLTEPEILHIFSDVSEGVACMHYLKPPLLHRDLKVENVLISSSGSSRSYKLCDFGSTAPPRPAATTAAEGRLIEDDVQKHTTMQYRSPEMIDVYRKQPIDEKSDIWALGVLLYKLCYYTTPFEEQGQMAILNATYKFPAYPAFSDRIKKLIASMLRENPQQRPNIYQVVREVCSMRNTSIPIKDIYTHRTESESRRNEKLPSPQPSMPSPPIVGISKTQPIQNVTVIPDITPMRRGRPTAPSQQHQATKPSPSPRRGPVNDPFAALDSDSLPVRAAAADELASRFPSLDEFSLLHDRGSKFQFSQASPVDAKQGTLNKRLTEALADEAFALPTSPPVDSKQITQTYSGQPGPKESKSTELPTESSRQAPAPQIYQPTPQKPSMISTGTMTSRSPSPSGHRFSESKSRPVWRVPQASTAPQHHRAFSQPRAAESFRSSAPSLTVEPTPPQRPALLDFHRSKSQTSALTIPKSPVSSRPSLEGQRPSTLELSDPIDRSKSANASRRPSSVHVESSLDYLRDRELSRTYTQPGDSKPIPSKVSNILDLSDSDEKNISSNVEFLRAIEGDDSSKKKDRRRSSSASKHGKRGSLSSISLSNTKNILAGRFGDAFRRFENNNPPSQEPRTPTSPLIDHAGPTLTPIAGSEATGGRTDDEDALDESEELPPEIRRELERRRLSEEEKRVAEAAAEYRKRLQEQGDNGKGGKLAGPGGSRASAIQNRVKSLMEDSKTSLPPRTAEGYGRFTNPASSQQQPEPKVAPAIVRKPVPKPLSKSGAPTDLTYDKPKPTITNRSPVIPQATAPPAVQRTANRPNPPTKPQALRTGGTSPVKMRTMTAPPQQSNADVAITDPDEWEANFSKRYPSLSGLEMVEAEIGKAPPPVGIRTKDV